MFAPRQRNADRSPSGRIHGGGPADTAPFYSDGGSGSGFSCHRVGELAAEKEDWATGLSVGRPQSNAGGAPSDQNRWNQTRSWRTSAGGQWPFLWRKLFYFSE